MTDKSFTLFEIHLHDGFSFNATNAVPSIGGSSDEEGADADADESGGSLRDRAPSLGGGRGGGAGGALGALLVLALLVGVAAAARSIRSVDEPEHTELEDFAEQ